MCCLKYEQDHYEATRKRLPRVGRDVMTPDGLGTVQEVNILRETVRVRVMKGEDSETKDYPADQVKRLNGRRNEPEITDEEEEFIETAVEAIEDENVSLDDE